jgi:peptide chain release factor 2
MVMRMYLRFCESEGLVAQVTYILEGEDAGLQSAEIEISGEFAFGKLKGEAGTHRLVRQSPFNANALRQTSFCGVIVTPIVEEASDIEIKESDLQIDSFRSSGKGGQSVNTTNSAVRVKHLPTGITVARQDQRSFEQNKASAIESLRAKLKLLQEQEFQAELEAIKQGGDVANFGTQIRNYVLHPYKLVKDLRTGFESKEPEKVLDGDLGEFVDSYIRWLIINSDKP